MARRTAAVALLTLAVTSCGGTDHPDTTVVDAGGVAVAVETQELTGAAAGVGLGGTLELLDGQCVGFGFGSRGVLALFAEGTTVSGSGRDLVVSANGVEMRLGDQFSAGSRYSSPLSLGRFSHLADQVPVACRGRMVMPVEGFER